MNRLRIAALLVLALPALASAGSRISYRNLDGPGSQTVLVGAGKIRVDADSDNRLIIDPAKGSVLVLHLADREYLRLDRPALQRWVAQANDVLGRVDDMLANVPEEFRGSAQGLMGGSGPLSGQSISVIDSGVRGSAAGHPCTIWRSSRSGERLGEACVGDVDAWELAATDRATANAAIAMLQDWSRELGRGAVAKYAKLSPLRAGQVPLRIQHDADGERGTWEFAGSDSIDLDAGDFAVPAGFREKPIEIHELGR